MNAEQTTTAGALAQLGLDLHDGPLQDAAYLLGHVRALRSDVAAGRSLREVEAAAAELEEVAAGLERGLRALARRLTQGDGAEPAGLRAGLAAAVARFEQRGGGRVDVALAGALDELEPETADALAHVAGEALENARRHSGARHVVVRVDVSDAGVRLEVADDGRGFDPDAVPAGIGRRGMADRLQRLGGRLAVESEPGRGATVRAFVPAGRAGLSS